MNTLASRRTAGTLLVIVPLAFTVGLTPLPQLVEYPHAFGRYLHAPVSCASATRSW